MQKVGSISPKFLNLDGSYESLQPSESPYIRDITWDQNQNLVGSVIGEGNNQMSITPLMSNKGLPLTAPAGYNKNIGSFYSPTTNETYILNFNVNGNHGVYVIDGGSLAVTTVIIDPNLNFTDEQDGFIASHRVSIRTFLDTQRNVIEKILVMTDGNSWQKWILVNSAIQTNGFNATDFPYWTLQPPHFDRRELIEWAVRSPMYKPIVATIQNTSADTDKVNRLIDQCIQVAYAFQMTDGRSTVFSPYSLPLIVKSEDYLSNPDNLPKNALFTFYAGSPLVEKILIYIRKSSLNQNSIPTITEWSDWYLYDTIYKFSNSETSESSVIGTQYWTRSDQWSLYNYDSNLNTIQYQFDNSRVCQVIDQTDAAKLQNDIPQLSVALSDLGDAELLSNNRRDYDNLSSGAISNFSVEVIEKTQQGCSIPTRHVRLYAYIGRDGDRESWESQVGYFNGSDTQMRFGGLQAAPSGTSSAQVNISQSKLFNLDFADKDAFRLYLNGTPYYADGTWYQINSDNSLVKLSGLLDFSNTDVLTFVQNIFIAGGYFVCVFDLQVPAGRYIASIGRHNVASSGDYRNTSTYVLGIANSRVKTTGTFSGTPVTSINPQTAGTIISNSKQMEIDCVAGDVDVWGNGADLFYIYCPFESTGTWRFIEGYFEESVGNPIGVELFPYTMTQGWNVVGVYTDKNGFYFGSYRGPHADVSDILFSVKLNCIYPNTFNIQTNQAGQGYRVNGPAYITDHNNGVVGDCNRVLVTGTVTSLDGTTPYSNIAISIKDGNTFLSASDGTFTLVVHNGENNNRVSNIYVNAAGNFLIALTGCGYIPLYHYNEALAPCINCDVRNYPVLINLNIQIQDSSQTSVKEGGSYSIGGLVADLAGRLTFVNVITETDVPSFTERQDLAATFFRLLINGSFSFSNVNPDFKWFCPVVSRNLTESSYLQWVGDSIQYIDNNGNVVTDVSSAVYCSIAINSLYNYNVSRNFSTLANYQFVVGDRIRILDDGNGNLLTGNPLDFRILGQNYNQAAMNAGLLPNNSTVPVVNNNIGTSASTSVTSGSVTTTISLATQQNNTSITLYVLYDPRLTPLINSTGFWIELYTPALQSDTLIYREDGGFYPIVNGRIANFDGYNNGVPVYDYPDQIDLDYWDTYMYPRNITIPNVGDKFFSHPFESPNISDSFGANITSGGRLNVKNDNAKQMWYIDESIKSDDFVSEGLLNGIGTFRSSNRKSFKDFKSGGIVAVKALRNLVAFICENDYFITDYNFQYIYANAQGVQIANLDNNLGSPHQKIGDAFGCAYEDTGTILFYDKFIFWYDYKNEAFIQMGWGPSVDVTVEGLVKGYFSKKTQTIKSWNRSSGTSKVFDVMVGVDPVRNNIYISFRPRRSNSNNPLSYFNNQENVNLLYQETIIYNLPSKRFVRFTGQVPESFGMLKGVESGLELLSFAAGIPYVHNNAANPVYCMFYGNQAIPCFHGVMNADKDFVKVLENTSVNSVYDGYFISALSSEESNSFSYTPWNFFKRKENMYYAPVLRNMSSYPSPNTPNDDLYRSTLTDSAGKRVFGRYFICRFVAANPGNYSELQSVEYLYTQSGTAKK